MWLLVAVRAPGGTAIRHSDMATWGRRMVVQQAAMREDQVRGLGRLVRGLRQWLQGWPLLAQPPSLVAYVMAVLAGDFAVIGWELSRARPHAGELFLFGALLACGAVCIEATRRLGMPAGVSRDLLSAWWLPIALLLPPVYVLIAPLLLTVVMQVRVRRSAVYRRLFSAAALGLSGG